MATDAAVDGSISGLATTERLDRRARRSALAGAVFLALVAAWLLAAAALVDIEYYDGLSAICNARYFLGLSPLYLFDRGPLMAWLQMPAESLKVWLALHPLQVRPHHATMAVLHVGYLVVVYGALVRHFGQGWSTLMAFATAVTSFIFSSYAPFISHDILPGALFLWMLIWSEDIAASPRIGRWWLLLVAAGTVAALVKQTFGVFWIAVLLAHVVSTVWLRPGRRDRTGSRAVWWLAGGAVTSGVLAWAIYGIVLASWAPDTAVWLRPYHNLQYLAHVYDGTDVTFPLWIYVKNWWAYGRLTTLLLIPGLALSLGGSPLQRRAALAWITAVVFVHAMPLREVRYMAFVAPLSAFVIVPAIRMFATSRPGSLLIAALLLLDLSSAVLEAGKVATPFYRDSALKTLLEPLTSPASSRRPLFHTTSMLSFVAPGQSPLAADRYHHIFHVGAHQIGILYGYRPDEVRWLLPPQASAVMSTTPEGSPLLFSNVILAHGPTWVPAPPIGGTSFVQGLATAQTVVLSRRQGDLYETASGETITVRAEQHASGAALVIDTAGLDGARTGYLVPVAIIGGRSVYPLQPRPDGRLLVAVTSMLSPREAPDVFTIRFFAIQRRTAPPAPAG